MNTKNLACELRAFLAKEPVPFSTISEFQGHPDPEIDRLIQHLHFASREDKPWVTVTTHDLRSALILIVKHGIEKCLGKT